MAKVKIRVAVAVDPKGAWNASGWGDAGERIDQRQSRDHDSMGLACETLESGEARYWLEAEVDIPEVKTIQAAAREH